MDEARFQYSHRKDHFPNILPETPEKSRESALKKKKIPFFPLFFVGGLYRGTFLEKIIFRG